jgi:histidinol-phosphate phosphatase family protein
MSGATKRSNALLLAGGLGTRLRPLTDMIPKCLIPVAASRPLLDVWIDRLAEAGIREARINTHALAEQVRTYIARINSESRLRLIESYEPTLLGSAGTVTANADLTSDADQIVIIYADNLTDIDLRPLLSFHRTHHDPFTMVLFRAPNPRACGIAELDSKGRIVSFVEKPEQPASNLANAGLYVVDAAAYREIAEMRAFDLGYEVLPRFVGRMRGWVWGGYYLDIGTHEALDRARQDVVEIFPTRRDSGTKGLRPAVFLDCDGALIEHVQYLDDPKQVRLLPDAAEAIKRLRRAGFACVLVFKQSAVGRGMITETRLDEIHAEIGRQLAERGASVDGIYFSPDVPIGYDRTSAESHNRNPGPGLLHRAAADLGLEMATSWMVGDKISDVMAGLNAGCQNILLTSDLTPGTAPEAQSGAVGRHLTAPSFAAAANIILNAQGAHS